MVSNSICIIAQTHWSLLMELKHNHSCHILLYRLKRANHSLLMLKLLAQKRNLSAHDKQLLLNPLNRDNSRPQKVICATVSTSICILAIQSTCWALFMELAKDLLTETNCSHVIVHIIKQFQQKSHLQSIMVK